MHWSDGNLAALRQYEREQDELELADRMLREAQQSLADDFYDAYIEGLESVVEELDYDLMDDDSIEQLLHKMRKAMVQECDTHVAARGAIVHKTYMNIISRACEDLAERAETIDDVEDLRNVYGV